MSIEDIDYLKENSIKESYNFLVDSKDRDKSIYPDPNNYVITFTEPFRNVIALEIIDFSVPRTMYAIDIYNNILYVYIGKSLDDPIIVNGFNSSNYDINLFLKIEIPVGDYTINNFVPFFNNYMNDLNYNIQINYGSNPPDLTNLIYFSSTMPFILNMSESTISETIGFDSFIKKNNNGSYNYISNYVNYDNNIFQQLFHSLYDNINGYYFIKSPGSVYFIGEKYVIVRCPEIEEHLYRSLSYSKYNLGIGKFRVNTLGFNEPVSSSSTLAQLREFHPIGKLPKMTLKFQTANNNPYDFKGVNHNIVFCIYYYQPKLKVNIKFNSLLNPNYKSNYNEYLKNEEEQELEDEDEDEEDELSRDNLLMYKKFETKYNH